MFQTASYTDPGGRPCNEDCTAVQEREGKLCLVVADGLGGHGGGAQASARAAEILCAHWDGRVEPEALQALFQEAHAQVLSLQTPDCPMKTTAAALLLEDGRAAWAHVGDTRLYHFYNGRLAFQTRDHSVSQVAVLLGDIAPEQIRFHPDRNRVLRALGQAGDVRVEARGEPLFPGRHAFLLCSDGFWEYVLEEEMGQDLAAAADPADWIARMRARLRARVPADNDNNTAAAVWLRQK